MSLGPVGSPSGSVAARLAAMRDELETLQRQLGTGRRAATYAGLGSSAGPVVGLRASLQAVAAREAGNELVEVRLDLLATTLRHAGDLTTSTRSALDPNAFDLLTDGRTRQQASAEGGLGELLSLLGTEVDGRYLFGGKATDRNPVATLAAILEGEGARAGLKQIVAERREADRGSDGRGRVTVGGAGATVTLTEDGGHPFGFKLKSAAEGLTGVTLAGPSGTPAALSLAVAAQPKAGETLRITLALPDGSEAALTLTADTSNDPAAGTFAIGATTAATAANLRTALGSALQRLGETEIVAASAVRAAEGFFGTYQGVAPERVAGPPFATATALRPGTADDTVQWYRGDADPTSPRDDAMAEVEAGLAIRYGVRADEPAFARVLAGLGAVVVTSLAGGGDTERALSTALLTRARDHLAPMAGAPTIRQIEVEIGQAQATLGRARERNATLTSALSGKLDALEGADPNAVAVQLLALQTKLQASYQATSILYRLSLKDYV